MSLDKQKQPLCHQVAQALESYFAQLDGHDVVDLHALVISEVEKPLLEAVLNHTKSNQSKAAKMLGLSRGTLRKKLAAYQLDI
ncbi:MAG: DNA-binding transcriptional regulator Fis [Cycloclasticus sp.]|jgi:Fis family transcriptional regulator|nr:MAG: Fis family transcriptional regulator [Cycloclasticus sp. Phe_18]MBV1912951.1 DNA-binding transcriptional regulator Fis [Cycloclasticus sp.]MDF1689440.1 DNA-binding transcriptional regulator Fis [Cycloclasticus sp.]MEE4291313.1 DNA-binding transcriptional regulator Fis [Cycloclasticus sp.]